MAVVGLVAVLPLFVAVWTVFRRPQRGVLVLAALAPLDGLLLIIPHPSVIDGWPEVMLLLLVLASAARRPEDPSARGGSVPTWAWATAGLVTFLLLRAAIEPSAQAAVGLRLHVAFALVLIVLWRHPLDEFDRDDLVTVLMVGGVITSLVGIGQQVVGAEALSRMGYPYNDVIRTTNGLLRSFSTFNQPFPFAFYSMTALLVSLPVALADRARRRNRWFLVVSPVLLVGMSTALVRAAMAGLLVGILVLMVLRHRALVHGLLGLVLVGLLAWPIFGSALVSRSSLDDRTAGWTESIDQVLASPFGSGVGTVGAAAEKAVEEGDGSADRFLSLSGDTPYQPDNHYMKVLLELGPIGLWLFLIVVVSAGKHASVLSQRAGPSDSPLALGITAAIAGAATAGLASTYWEIFPVDLHFWILLGVLTSIEHSSATTLWPSAQEDQASRPTYASSSGLSRAAREPN